MTGGDGRDRRERAGTEAVSARWRLSETAVLAATSPMVIGALLVLVVNDHVAKARWPGPATGIASDIAGLVLLPVVVAVVADLVRRTQPTAGFVVVLGVAVAAGFAAVELLPAADAAYEHGLGALSWPLRSLAPGTQGRVVEATADPADLLALPAAFTGTVLWRRAERMDGAGSTRAARTAPDPQPAVAA